jgi:hypothetical protein
MSDNAPPKLAAVVTTYFKYSHAQQIVDRLLDGYGWNGTYHHPPIDLVSLFVDQVGKDDLSRERASRHPGMRIYPTIAEALTAGGSKLAVDAVLIVGEHGNYPRNEKRQTKYPRYEFFEQVVKVFQDSGRVVPVFSDKHLSWNWEWARKMYDTSREMKFPFMAGSSLPVTWRIPSVEMPLGARITEAMCVGYGGVDSYDFHALETIQCMVERRRGGETGVEWLQAYSGEKFWEALAQGVWPRALMDAALCRSHTLLSGPRGSVSHVIPSVEDMRRLARGPVAYRYQHSDGLKCTMILLNGMLRDFNFAAYVNGASQPWSTQMYLPMPDDRTTLASFFSPLVHHFETMYLTGKATYPVERTLLTTGLTAAGMESLFRGQVRYDTPHLAIRYEPTKESTFWRT